MSVIKKILIVLAVLFQSTQAFAIYQSSTIAGGAAMRGADVTPPQFSSATISGTTVTVHWTEACTRGAGYNDTDLDLDMSTTGANIGVTYVSGDGTPDWVFTAASPAVTDETVDLDFNGDANSIEDGSGNDLAALVSSTVLNITFGRVGTPEQFCSNLNTSTQAITVPANANFAVVLMAGFEADAEFLSSAVVSMTINSVSMTSSANADTSTSAMMAGTFYLTNPSTGSQTFAWDFVGTDTTYGGVQFYIVYYAGVNTSTPVQSTGGEQATDGDATTGSLAADSGDAFVGVATGNTAGTCDLGWTNATEADQDTCAGDTSTITGGWAYDDSLSGAVTVTVTGTGDCNVYVTTAGLIINKGS